NGSEQGVTRNVKAAHCEFLTWIRPRWCILATLCVVLPSDSRSSPAHFCCFRATWFALLSGIAAGWILLCVSDLTFLSPRRPGKNPSWFSGTGQSVDSVSVGLLGISAFAWPFLET